MITVGEILKKAREKKKMNISEVQSMTKIVSRYIEALENNKFDDLPGDIYVKGFLKNISEVLDLNPKEVIELYRLQKTGIVGVLQASNPKNKIKKQQEQKLSKQKKELEEVEIPVLDNEENEVAEEERDIETTGDLPTEIESEEESKEIDEKFVLPPKPQVRHTTQTSQGSQSSQIALTSTVNAAKKKAEQFDLYSAESALLMLSKEDISLSNSRKNRNKILLITLLSVLFLAIIGLLFRNNIAYLLFRGKNEKVNTNVQRNIVDTVANQNVKVGDVVYFKPLGISATIKFLSIGNVVRININGSDMSLSKSNPVIVDLNNNGVNDFRMTLIEVYEDLATVRMERLEENQMVNSNVDIITNDENNVFVPEAPVSSSEVTVINGEIYIETDVEKKEIKVDITAKHFVYVRYFIDSDRPATVNLLSGRSLNLEARDVIMLTVGNAAEVVVKINNKVVSLGEYGETVNKTIKWVKNVNDSTKFSLVVSDTK